MKYITRLRIAWTKTHIVNKLTFLLTLVIAGANIAYVCYARKQFIAMSGQLQQMQASGGQTDKLLQLYQNQLTELQKQSADTHVLSQAAGKQADAAQSASVTTREALTSVQRAFVSFFGTASANKTIVANKATDLVFTLPWLNSGVTPTKNADSRVNWKVFPGDLPADFDFSDLGSVQNTQFEIFPRGFGNGTLSIPIAYLDAARQHKLHLFVWGWITYNDIFDKTPLRLSEFCDEITDIKSSNDDMADVSSNLTWQLSLCHVHNCSDERCTDYKPRISKLKESLPLQKDR